MKLFSVKRETKLAYREGPYYTPRGVRCFRHYATYIYLLFLGRRLRTLKIVDLEEKPEWIKHNPDYKQAIKSKIPKWI